MIFVYNLIRFFLERQAMSILFTPLKIRDLIVRNRIVMAPMCLYASDESGLASEIHLVHYGARALGGLA